MAVFSTARDLARHVDFCERESQRRAEEVQRALERLESQIKYSEERRERDMLELRAEMLRMHTENRGEFRSLWSTLRWGIGIAVVGSSGVLLWVAEHGGFIGLVKGF